MEFINAQTAESLQNETAIIQIKPFGLKGGIFHVELFIDDEGCGIFPSYTQASEKILQMLEDFVSGSAAKRLWSDLGDQPFGEDECLEDEWENFDAGTDREEIWHWFEKTFDLSVRDDLMFPGTVS